MERLSGNIKNRQSTRSWTTRVRFFHSGDAPLQSVLWLLLLLLITCIEKVSVFFEHAEKIPLISPFYLSNRLFQKPSSSYFARFLELQLSVLPWTQTWTHLEALKKSNSENASFISWVQIFLPPFAPRKQRFACEVVSIFSWLESDGWKFRCPKLSLFCVFIRVKKMGEGGFGGASDMIKQRRVLEKIPASWRPRF